VSSERAQESWGKEATYVYFTKSAVVIYTDEGVFERNTLVVEATVWKIGVI
jgi:hypothetical protein